MVGNDDAIRSGDDDAIMTPQPDHVVKMAAQAAEECVALWVHCVILCIGFQLYV